MLHGIDGLCAEIGEEGEGYDGEDGDEARGTEDVLHILHTVEAMIAAWVEDAATHEGCDELGEGHRAPNHDEGEGEEAFRQVDALVGPCELQADQYDKEWDDISRETETPGDEEMRYDGAQ